MKRMLLINLVLSLIWATGAVADTGPFFNVSTLGSQLTINTVANSLHPHHVYYHAGILSKTPGFSLENNNCILSGKGYCLFPVNDQIFYTATISGPAGAFNLGLCLNGKGPYTCEDHPITGNRFAYLGSFNLDNLVETCPMDPVGGGISTTSCLASTVGGTPNASSIRGIAFNKAGTRAYVALFDSSQIQLCSVDPTNGALFNCGSTATSNPPLLNAPVGVVLNSAGTFAYIANYASAQLAQRGIIKCTVETNSGALVSCSRALSTKDIDGPNFIAINKAGNYLYVTDASITQGIIYKCSVDTSTGNITGCAPTGTPAEVDVAPEGIALSPSGLVAYVFDNTSGTIFYCAVAPGTGELTNCRYNSTASCINFYNSNQSGYGLAINSAGTEVYAVSIDNTILSAQIGPTGAIVSCSTESGPTTGGFTGINNIALR